MDGANRKWKRGKEIIGGPDVCIFLVGQMQIIIVVLGSFAGLLAASTTPEPKFGKLWLIQFVFIEGFKFNIQTYAARKTQCFIWGSASPSVWMWIISIRILATSIERDMFLQKYIKLYAWLFLKKNYYPQKVVV